MTAETLCPHTGSAPRPSRRPRILAGLTVLVVEDDEASAEYFAIALRTAGASVVTASTAVDALHALHSGRTDVVLSDIAMPGHDGYWLVREIRRLTDPALRDVPVVATTAHGESHSRERTLRRASRITCRSRSTPTPSGRPSLARPTAEPGWASPAQAASAAPTAGPASFRGRKGTRSGRRSPAPRTVKVRPRAGARSRT